MDAVSTASLYQSALLNIMNAQSNEATAAEQASTQKVATDIQGYGASAATLTASNTVQSRITGYLTNGQAVAGKLAIQDSALTSLSDTAQTATKAISSAIGNNDATGLMTTLANVFGQAKSALNTQYDGQYVFAGGQVNTAPFSGASLSSLPATPLAGQFQNDQNAATNRLDDNTVVTTGFLASNVGQPLMQALSDLQAYAAGPSGPLSGTLTSKQNSDLQGILSEFSSALTSTNAVVAQNGTLQNQVDNVQTTLTDQQTALTGVISNITDVNLAQVATNLTLAQTALEASAKVFTSLQSDSLLNLLSSTS